MWLLKKILFKPDSFLTVRPEFVLSEKEVPWAYARVLSSLTVKQ